MKSPGRASRVTPAVLLGVALLAFGSASDALPKFKLVYQSDSAPLLSFDFDMPSHPARLYDNNQECLVQRDSKGFQILEFVDSTWHEKDRFHSPILATPLSPGLRAISTVAGRMK